MVHFAKIVPGIQESYLMIRNAAQTNEPLTKADMEKVGDLLRNVAKAVHERIFIVMTAQTRGWQFAKDLDFYQTGIYLSLKFLQKDSKDHRKQKKFFVVTGDEADENFQKVAKKHAKKELKEKEERKPKKARPTPYSRNPFPAFNPWTQMSMQAMAMPPMWPMHPQLPAAAAASASPMAPRLPKSQLRCNNCAEYGHFARECPKPPLPSGPK